ncbi:hypothetical protein K443DRAFT_554823 [Laccaria amethystina LaAM-08-1]|uniref:Uncharacterized protein n=1 Tax=Laccaria amethystina LaAM-08-1 TaxID=1095629 RepID=A0A0C9XJG1_9AGAR|nr:hypothetical protein K443DRAFT_554823 [Laccaria amethystina LaAM-08-1]
MLDGKLWSDDRPIKTVPWYSQPQDNRSSVQCACMNHCAALEILGRSSLGLLTSESRNFGDCLSQTILICGRYSLIERVKSQEIRWGIHGRQDISGVECWSRHGLVIDSLLSSNHNVLRPEGLKFVQRISSTGLFYPEGRLSSRSLCPP